jgi:hypothetical protein
MPFRPHLENFAAKKLKNGFKLDKIMQNRVIAALLLAGLISSCGGGVKQEEYVPALH